MARPQAEMKLCFYPASEIAIADLVKHLTVKPLDPMKRGDATNILDPCCGKGAAIKQIADALKVDEDHVYTVELDKARSENARALMPKHQHLGPASFLGIQITGSSFGLAYVNPPYGDEIGGGKREEFTFTERATRTLVNHGVLALVIPLQAISGNSDFCNHIDSNYDNIAVYKFPDSERHYKEIVIFAKKRATPISTDDACNHGKLHEMKLHWGYIDMESLPYLGGHQPSSWAGGRASYNRDENVKTWEIPLSWKPHTFKKTMFTDEELLEVIANSPLNRLLAEVPEGLPEAPPLPLDRGHLGLILSSGMLDGVVHGPHGIHVVRGSSHKVEYHNKAASGSTESESGAVTTKDVFSQRLVTTIRTVEQDGKIATHSNCPVEKDEDFEEDEEEMERMSA
jgi:predicted RNA methylase